MSAVLTPRRTRRGRDRDRDAGRVSARQESLFGAYAAPEEAPPAAVPTAAVPTATPVAEPEQAAAEPMGTATLTGPTLDEAMSALWGELTGGATATCPVCGTAAMQPRHSAGAGVVGGRCGSCDATLA